jgi:hypothetical protein
MSRECDVIIRGTDGGYWLQTKDFTGRLMSSYVGHIGGSEFVEAWCESHGLEFREVGFHAVWAWENGVARKVGREADVCH